ncbi:MAG: hypothetical protein JSW08_02850 [archaeon]|nr:MAG: hypothetical protein JSW08_02850 [archaeon]
MGRYISSFIAVIFGLVTAVLAFIGLAINKGYFTERLEQLPPDPTVYFIALIVLGILMIIISLGKKQGF